MAGGTVGTSTEKSYAVSDEVSVTYAPEQVALPTLYVLAIGISEYPDEQVKLRYAAIDALAIADAFVKHGKGVFAEVKADVIADKDATRVGILRGLNGLKSKMTQRDMAVIYYSGHGVKDSDGVFYLYPVDGVADDLEVTAVAEHSVKKYCQALPGRLVVMLDACHAGQAEALVSGGRKSVTGATDDLVRDLVTEDYGVIVMASSMGAEFSIEHEAWGHGAFTKALTEGLAGKADRNTDGLVYFHELDGYVTDRVKELTAGRQHPVTGKPTTIRSFPLARP